MSRLTIEPKRLREPQEGGQSREENRDIRKELILKYRGVAQVVARLLWEQDAAGSSPVTSTTFPLKPNGFRGFFILFSIVAKTVICYNIYDYTKGGIYFAYFILRL